MIQDYASVIMSAILIGVMLKLKTDNDTKHKDAEEKYVQIGLFNERTGNLSEDIKEIKADVKTLIRRNGKGSSQ